MKSLDAGKNMPNPYRNIKDCTFVVRALCADCKTVLNETKEVSAETLYQDWTMIIMSSGFSTKACPNGCEPTFSDLNIHTDLVFYEKLSNQPFDFQSLKLLRGNFYKDDYYKVCDCENIPSNEIFFSDDYPPVHGKCGRWIMAYDPKNDTLES